MNAHDLALTGVGDSPPGADVVGANLRRVRQAGDLSLKAAAARTSVSSATLSRIENGLMSPTFDVMIRICEGFGISITDLVDPRPASTEILRIAEIPLGTGRRVETPQYRFEFLSEDRRGVPFLTLRADVLCRSMAEFGPMHAHAGWEQIIVQSGSIEVRIAQQAPRRLSVGDMLAFDSQLEHAVIAPAGKASILWIYAATGGV
ncbi:hypothetical protein DL1_18285 [Thioclava dalianensis]|uniref:HTH cro/C1-type domain-containing protein n=1 Tax=Thioclava dalianensis TaxID=1185766 RepID=A0A074T7X4_9RHOB|nr:XRE family transcriptional regulator [Thioclava dalianensis]KEP67896.1 hypothetical protein DL1_18285 [Thioclava dalianensis]SFN92840.1 Transcriptional regulator, contains XRE-family HTH domain [Thioclava dalianensis]